MPFVHRTSYDSKYLYLKSYFFISSVNSVSNLNMYFKISMLQSKDGSFYVFIKITIIVKFDTFIHRTVSFPLYFIKIPKPNLILLQSTTWLQ